MHGLCMRSLQGCLHVMMDQNEVAFTLSLREAREENIFWTKTIFHITS